MTLPVNPAFASLNLAQAVVIVAYEWFKLASGGELPFAMPEKSAAGAASSSSLAFFDNLERELEKVEFFRPPEKRATMLINLRNIFTPHGADPAGHPDLARRDHGDCRRPQGTGARWRARRRRGASCCARCWPSTAGALPAERGPVRGLARLLRRNPTEAERALWDALMQGSPLRRTGFKRQTPVGPHICRFRLVPARAS